MTSRSWFFITLASAILFTVGCGKKQADAEAGQAHAEHAEGGERGGVSFKAGHGLQLSPEIIQALGLTTVEATERPLSSELRLTAQVYATKPEVLASVRLPADQADALEKTVFKGAKLVRIDRSAVTATRLVDLLFALDADPSSAVGEFVSLTLTGEPVSALTVPRSAILDAATGTFAYVVNGSAYLRTPVKIGGHSADYFEITDGLYTGDSVVVSPVDQLWLAELRLTKGGGHSH